MPSVEMKEVEIFLALAEELHFGRAAERLYLTQSRVSQAIRALEARVGGLLFERTTRRVRLTPVGEKLRDRLAPAYAELEEAFAAAKDLATGVVGELRISILSMTVVGPAFSRIQSAFRDQHPGCRVTVREELSLTALADMRRGEVDLCAMWLPLRQPDLTVGPILTRQERVLLVRVGHPLLEKGYATVEDLGDYAVADVGKAVPRETSGAFCPRYTPSGRPIPRACEVYGIADLMSAVAGGVIVHPTMKSFPRQYQHPDVTHMPMRGLAAGKSALVWVTARETAAIRAFAHAASDIVAAAQAHDETVSGADAPID